jgi:hypothetical protein
MNGRAYDIVVQVVVILTVGLAYGTSLSGFLTGA